MIHLQVLGGPEDGKVLAVPEGTRQLSFAFSERTFPIVRVVIGSRAKLVLDCRTFHRVE